MIAAKLNVFYQRNPNFRSVCMCSRLVQLIITYKMTKYFKLCQNTKTYAVIIDLTHKSAS